MHECVNHFGEESGSVLGSIRSIMFLAFHAMQEMNVVQVIIKSYQVSSPADSGRRCIQIDLDALPPRNRYQNDR
jgi:hypothetical protein